MVITNKNTKKSNILSNFYFNNRYFILVLGKLRSRLLKCKNILITRKQTNLVQTLNLKMYVAITIMKPLFGDRNNLSTLKEIW